LTAALPVSLIRQFDTHRLIPSKYSDSVLTRIADDDAHLKDIFDLDHATNDRERWPASSGQRCVFDKWTLCRLPL
jgi:hypothetical protein